MSDLSLSVRIFADASRYAAGLLDGTNKTHKFASAVKTELASVREAMGGLTGQMTALAGGVTALSLGADSAKLDKSLTGIQLNAGASREEVQALREDFFRMAQDSGRNVEDLRQGFGNLVAMGQDWKAAREEIKATNIAMAVTNASADKLTGALGVAGESFQFDLAKPGQALLLLDKMTLAGRKGNAELENLSDIFARVGVNAAGAGMGFDQTLGFIEGLSLIEKQPERLATLADSTLRLFNNQHYRKDAEKATGVKFFDPKGNRRDALAVIGDIKKQFDKLKTEAERDSFLNKAFGKADLDTLKGMRILLSGDTLGKVKSFSSEIAGASGTLERDLPGAISNAVDQTGRLKAALREAADNFAQPINDTLSNVIKWGMDKKENGGLALDGGDMLLGGAGLAAGTFLAARYGGKAIGSLLGKGGDLATGVATGKALQEMAGVQSVYVVNMPGDGIAGSGGQTPGTATAAEAAVSAASRFKTGAAMAGGLPLKEFLTLGASAWATASAGVLAAGAAGYGAGTVISKSMEGTKAGNWVDENIGGGIARVLALFGNENAQQAVAITEKLRQTEIKGTVSVNVTTAPGIAANVSSTPGNKHTTINTGKTMAEVR